VSKRRDDERGDTLIEILIAIVLIGLMMGVLFASITMGSTGSNNQKNLATADGILRNYAESAKTAVRTACATLPTFTVAAPTLPDVSWRVSSTPNLTGQTCPSVTTAPGILGGGVLASISSGVKSGAQLATARNREYAADAAIESSIARVRIVNESGFTPTGWPACGTDPTNPTFEKNPDGSGGVSIHVDCLNAPTVAGVPAGSLALQNDVMFNACLASAAPCTPANTIISADVNFRTSGSNVPTNVLSWSVNG
jgi:prepilin-type N-terminal cleavage/methylation domain-containing protein